MNREWIPGLAFEARAPAARDAGGPAAWLALALPLGLALWSASGQARWSDDGAILRDLGLYPLGSEGALSTVLTQLATLLPLGGRLLRASMVGVLALALTSRLLFGLLRDLLDRRARSPLNPLLAALGSTFWALGTDVQAASSSVGGPMPALALLLLGLGLARAAFERGDARALAATGLVLAATVAERHAAGLSLALMLAGLAVGERRRAWKRDLWRLLAAFAAGLLLFGSLRAVGFSGTTGAAHAALRVDDLLASARQLGARWVGQLGLVPLLLAFVGAILGAAHAPSRRQLWPWAFAAALGVLVPATAVGAEDGGVFAALSSLGALGFFALAVQALVHGLWACRLPFGRPAAVLTVMFTATFVLARADRASAERAPGAGLDTWTDEALTRLPARSVVLVHDARLAQRLLAARVLHGVRPDVVLLPTAQLTAHALREDPELADPSLLSLLRQLWVNGSADEYCLSALADERPVFVQPDPSWERRLLGHLAPDGVWARFSPHGLGRVDRRAGTAHSRAVLRRALALSETHAGLDPITRQVLAEAAARQAAVLGALGERELSGRMAHAAHVIQRSQLQAGLAQRYAEPARGRVAARDVAR